MATNRKNILWQVPLAVLLVVGTLYIACQRRQGAEAATTPARYQKEQGRVFGTFYSFSYRSDTSLKQTLEDALGEVDAEFSMFNDNSTVAAINRGESPRRSPMFEEVFALAQRVNADTGGAFDITVAPLVNAWGFGKDGDRQPTPDEVDSLLKVRSQMDFSAVAKGYGCDVVARRLRGLGVNDFMVEIGGEVVTSGQSPKGRAWRIGISKPSEDLDEAEDYGQVLEVTAAAMATSGNYRNFYYRDGKRYAHTIDPRTGYPVQHSLLSATVLAADCATADAYATSFMVMGLDSAKALLARHNDLRAYLIYNNSEGQLAVWRSEGLPLAE